jgi:hypothetical protein
MITEIPERVFIVNGYSIADRLLEDILFYVSFDDNGVTNITLDKCQKEYFESNFNSKKFYKSVKSYAESILEEGDEVSIPLYLEDKYFQNGINCAFIEAS